MPESAAAASQPRAKPDLPATRVTAKLDQLPRDASFLLTLRDSGVRFVAADMPVANDLTAGIIALVARQEREAIAKRMKRPYRPRKRARRSSATHIAPRTTDAPESLRAAIAANVDRFAREHVPRLPVDANYQTRQREIVVAITG